MRCGLREDGLAFYHVIRCSPLIRLNHLMHSAFIVGQIELFWHCISQTLTKRVFFFVYIVNAAACLSVYNKLCIKPYPDDSASGLV